MTRDDVIRMAREAGAAHKHNLEPSPEFVDFLLTFVALVTTSEREACAGVCDAHEDAEDVQGASYLAWEIRMRDRA